jgi:hypothetical protein
MLRPYLAQSKHYLFSIITTQREGCNMRERERERERDREQSISINGKRKTKLHIDILETHKP